MGVGTFIADDPNSKKVFLLRAGLSGFTSENDVLAYC
jgi:hypothetical protein